MVLQDLTFYGICANLVITMLGFAVIKFNDFGHLEKAVKKIQEDLTTTITKIIKIDKKQAVQEQKIKTLEKFKK